MNIAFAAARPSSLAAAFAGRRCPRRRGAGAGLPADLQAPDRHARAAPW